MCTFMLTGNQVNIDWAGIALERASGLKLNDYIQKNIFHPLGLKEMSMIPTADMKSKMAHMHSRDPQGNIRPRDHLQRLPLVIDDADTATVANVFNSGGAGMYAKPQEYTSELPPDVPETHMDRKVNNSKEVLAVLLNDGTCPRTGAKILRKETVDEMFINQIPKFPNFGRQGIPPSKPELTNPLPDLYPAGDNTPQGWGLTFMLPNSDATGRSKGTAFWAGLANLYWWCDREKGVAGMVCSQILPFGDAKVMGLWAGVEQEVYKGLAQ